jgi:FHA domain-containing protein
MTGMDDFINVQVARDGHPVASGRYKLPVTFGRMAQSSVQLGQSPADKTISRIHAQIDAKGGRLTLTDRSANGTLFHGRLLTNGEVVDLGEKDSFEIRGYKIQVSRAKRDPSAVTVLEGHIYARGRLAGKPIQLGEMMAMSVRARGGIRFELVPTTGEPNLQDITVRYRLDGEELLAAMIGRPQGSLLFVMPVSGQPAEIKLNRKPVKGNKISIQARDVIEINDIRIELHAPGERSLVCTNRACELLNPYNLHVNCRFCGFKLVGAETRLASGKSADRRK